MVSCTLALTLTFAATLQSCEELKAIFNFFTCEFRLSDTPLGNVRAFDAPIRTDAISLISLGSNVALALATNGNIPISLDVNVDVRNPNETRAVMNKADLDFRVDGKTAFSAQANEDYRLEVAGNSIGTLPVTVRIQDIRSVLSGQSDIIGFLTALAGQETDRLDVRLTPYIEVSGRQYKYPQPISLTNVFQGKDNVSM